MSASAPNRHHSVNQDRPANPWFSLCPSHLCGPSESPRLNSYELGRWIKILAVALGATTLFSGCQTTGDPERGSLLGWSEEKAKLRQAELRRQLTQEQERLAAEEVRNAELLRQKARP